MLKPTQEQKEKAEARRLKFRALAKQLGALPKAQRDALAARLPVISTIEGRTLSPFNMCLIAAQDPGATVVGGFRQWIKAGRSVRKGEHGLSLWVPTGAKDDATGAEKTRFIAGVVFDVAQTEPLETPEVKATCEQAIGDHFDPSGALRAAGIFEVVHVGSAA